MPNIGIRLRWPEAKTFDQHEQMILIAEFLTEDGLDPVALDLPAGTLWSVMTNIVTATGQNNGAFYSYSPAGRTNCTSMELSCMSWGTERTPGGVPIDVDTTYASPSYLIWPDPQMGSPARLHSTQEPVGAVVLESETTPGAHISDGPCYLADPIYEFTLSSCNKTAMTMGDSVEVTVMATVQVIGNVTARVDGYAASLIDSTPTSWTFAYTAQPDNPEGPITLQVGGSSADAQPITTDLVLPCIIDNTAPSVPDGPYRCAEISGNGTVIFLWDPSTDEGSGVAGYNVMIKRGAAVVQQADVGNTLSAAVTGTPAPGNYTCQVQAYDAVGNISDWTADSDPILVTYAHPLCTLSASASGTVAGPVNITMAFTSSEDGSAMQVTGLTRSLIRAVGAAIGDITTSDDSTFSFTLYPTSPGPVTLQVLAGTAAAVLNDNLNTASNVLMWSFDNIKPSCTVTPPGAAVSTWPISFWIRFSKPVTGFGLGDVTVVGGSCAALAGQGSVYTASIAPSGARPVSVRCSVAAGVAVDSAGNTNAASNTASTIFDDTTTAVTALAGTDVPGTTYGIGDAIRILATFGPSPVFVSIAGGRPYLTLVLGATGQTRRAYYESGSGSTQLIFLYTVSASDPACVLDHDAFQPNGGTVRDYAGLDVNLTLTTGMLDASALEIDPTHVSDGVGGINDDVASSATSSYIPAASSSLRRAIRTGIGDADDLVADVIADPREHWIPRIHKGWFYYKERELYLFAEKATQVFTDYSTGAEVTITPTDPDYGTDKILANGPVFVKGTIATTQLPYVQLASPLRAYAELADAAPVTGTNLYRYTVPGIPVELVRTDPHAPMRRVPDEDAIEDSHEYSQSVALLDSDLAYTVTVADTAPVYATYIPASGDPGIWVQHEVGILDSKRQIRAMYREVVPLADPTYKPKIVAIDSGERVEITSGFTLAGNLFTLPATYAYTDSDGNPATLSIEAGMRVALIYYVDHSFIISGNKLRAFTDDAATLTSLQIEYEGSTEESWDGRAVVRGNPSFVQLNPLKDGVRSGFLYVSDDDAVDMSPARLTVSVGPGAVTVHQAHATAQPARVVVRVTDRAGDPVRGAQITLTTRALVVMKRGAVGNIDSLEYVPPTIDGVAPTFTGVGRYVNGVWTYYDQSRYSIAWDSGWKITWSSPPAVGTDYIVLHTPAPGEFTHLFPASSTTDWRGELAAVWRASHMSFAIFCADIAGGGFYREAGLDVQQCEELLVAATDDSTLPLKVHLVATTQSREPGTVRVLAYATDLSGAYPRRLAHVYFHSASSKFTDAGPVVTDDDGIAATNYYLSGSDVIYASAGDIHSNKVRMGGDT